MFSSAERRHGSGAYGKRAGSTVLLLLALALPAGAQDITISEFLALNSSTLQDEDGEYSDWIELHNRSAGSIDLAGWHLTDDAANATRWTFPSTNIPSHGFLIVFASGNDRPGTNGRLHTNFRLSGDGEYLALLDPLTNVACSFAPGYPPQHADVSYGFPAHADKATYLNPTPGMSNTAGTVRLAAPPAFSVPAGFYTNTVTLELRVAEPSAVIRYTLDGAEPTTDSPVYAAPLTL